MESISNRGEVVMVPYVNVVRNVKLNENDSSDRERQKKISRVFLVFGQINVAAEKFIPQALQC